MANVQIIILKSGEHLLGDVSYSGGVYLVNNPLALMQVDAGKMGYVHYVDPQMSDQTTFEFDEADIRHLVAPKTDLINYWNQHFGSGIQLVTNPAQILVE